MPEHSGFRFGPRDRHGLIAGVRGSQVAVVGGALVLACACLYGLRGPARASPRLVVLAGAALAFLPIGGRTLEEWLPVVARYSSSGALGARHHTLRPARVPRPPATLAPFRVLELPLSAGARIGALHDSQAGVLAAVLSGAGGAFALRDSDERARLVDSWASVLASAAHGSAPYRLQWIVRSVPDGAEQLRRRIAAGWAASAADAAIRGHGRATRSSSPTSVTGRCATKRCSSWGCAPRGPRPVPRPPLHSSPRP